MVLQFGCVSHITPKNKTCAASNIKNNWQQWGIFKRCQKETGHSNSEVKKTFINWAQIQQKFYQRTSFLKQCESWNHFESIKKRKSKLVNLNVTGKSLEYHGSRRTKILTLHDESRRRKILTFYKCWLTHTQKIKTGTQTALCLWNWNTSAILNTTVT